MLTAICQVLARIPVGHVITYGDLAAMAGYPRAARRAGQALRQLPADTTLPWHRVINAQGRISVPEPAAGRQRERLEQEGVIAIGGRIDLARFRWQP
ncbi:cysteine methyltransferase [Microbulbifer flavimaris]|uniref:Cysteine methyltransferase n=2 Tax=Microbulbiferaceae TaxID=1706373 RepID=A0ABX4HWY7_9GAMM|nr:MULTISPECIES: MGMT family protein [Microbulbifer]KUJ81687.1 cysteine methyltransferase [Microbulbifer sp. ZGT114]PCO04612.1 cysteine methyltransferase [Microbulbifer flavimaris]